MTERQGHKKQVVTVRPQPPLYPIPNINEYEPFIPPRFEQAIANKGYPVFHERALRCPCLVKGNTTPLSNCKNCGGTGWIFVNKVETQMLFSSMGSKKNYSYQWSEADAGTAKVSCNPRDRVAYMDRLTLKLATTWFSQTLFLEKVPSRDDVLLAFLAYFPVLDIESAYLFRNENEPLILLKPDLDFHIVENRVEFGIDYPFPHNDGQAPTLTLRYKHNPQYHITEILRDVIQTPVRSRENPEVRTYMELPFHAVAQKAHYVLDAPNALGKSVFDNSDPNLLPKPCP